MAALGVVGAVDRLREGSVRTEEKAPNYRIILGVRGSPVLTLTNESTLLLAPKGKHSAKPDEFYALVESLCPASRYVELFARKQRPGCWDAWGDEVPRTEAAE